MLKRVVADENGRILVWALVILGLGALLLPVLLARVNTNLLASRAIEEGLKEQYSADSGVEYAMLQIREGITTSQNPYTYTINNKGVEVSWGEYITETYKITSTATSQIDGSSTTIESYISLNMVDFLWLLDQAITSPGDVTLQPGSGVTGGIRSPYEPGGLGTYDSWIQDTTLEDRWPPTGNLSDFYFGQVEGLTPYPSDSIDLKDTNTIGPLYRDGDLSVKNTAGYPITATLEGTIYVTGDLDFDLPGVYTIDLNGQTLYVELDIYFAPNVTISGSGCIIAEGFVNFQPSIDSSPDDFVFVMSIEDYVWLKPTSDFHGSVAGDTEIALQPNCSLTWREPPAGLNFPDGTTGRAQIHTYKVYP